jgi:hypothetical protein
MRKEGFKKGDNVRILADFSPQDTGTYEDNFQIMDNKIAVFDEYIQNNPKVYQYIVYIPETNNHRVVWDIEKIEEEFTLPDKWCVKPKNEEESNIIFTFEGISKHDDSQHINYFQHYPPFKNECTANNQIINGYTEITFEQFKKHVLNCIIVLKSDLKKIYEVVSPSLQEKIKQLTLIDPFGDTIKLTQEQVDELFEETTIHQHPTLESIFGKRKFDLDFRSNNIHLVVNNIPVFGSGGTSETDAFISLPNKNNRTDIFYLNPNYKWELNGTILHCKQP